MGATRKIAFVASLALLSLLVVFFYAPLAHLIANVLAQPIGHGHFIDEVLDRQGTPGSIHILPSLPPLH